MHILQQLYIQSLRASGSFKNSVQQIVLWKRVTINLLSSSFLFLPGTGLFSVGFQLASYCLPLTLSETMCLTNRTVSGSQSHIKFNCLHALVDRCLQLAPPLCYWLNWGLPLVHHKDLSLSSIPMD